MDLDLGADLKAHRTPGVEHDDVPDDSVDGPARGQGMYQKGGRGGSEKGGRGLGWDPPLLLPGSPCGPRHQAPNAARGTPAASTAMTLLPPSSPLPQVKSVPRYMGYRRRVASAAAAHRSTCPSRFPGGHYVGCAPPTAKPAAVCLARSGATIELFWTR